MPEENKTLKGKCGICGVSVFDTDERYKREPNEPYICVDCWGLVQSSRKCLSCTDLFDCPMDYDDTGCKE